MARFVTVVVAAAYLLGSSAYADDQAVVVAQPTAAPRPGAVEIAGERYREAWNYNLSDEDLSGGSATVWYPGGPRWSIGVETLVLWVTQERVPSTPLAGIVLLGRREFPRGRISYFVEGGCGGSYAARFAPAGGTRFNYIAGGAAGFIHQTAGPAQLVASFRFFHLSNGGLAGSDRNPDIEAFGVRIGVRLPLSP